MRLKQLLFLSALIPFLSQAQGLLYNKGADIYIQERALVEVQGGITNNVNSATGSMNNDGIIELTGDFENLNGATFKVHTNSASKERAVKFIGAGTQAIKGNMSVAGHSGFYNLIIDKASATDTVEMQTGVVTEGSLIFGSANTTATYSPSSIYTNNNNKGLLKTYSGTSDEFLLDIPNGNADAIAGYPILSTGGAPSTGFILTRGNRGSTDGGLQRAVSYATSYVFPVGTTSKGFNGVRLNFSHIPGGGSVKTKFCDGTNSVSGYVGQLSAYCSGCVGTSHADNNGYNRYFSSNPCNNNVPQWVIFDHTAKNHGYWSFASSNTGYQYDMEVFPNSYTTQFDPNSSWRVIKHEANYGDDVSSASVDWTPEIESLVSDPLDLLTYTKNAGCYSGAGIPGGIYTDFSHFTMAMTSTNNALPVKFIYVKAEPTGKHHIKVSWATAVEINNAGFEVMRSTDGTNFTDIGWVDGHNNSTVNQTYSFDDKVSQSNIPYYYKLRQVDYDQHFDFSDVVEATVSDIVEPQFVVYPNPTANDLMLGVTNPGGEVEVKMFDINGKQVYQNIFTIESTGGPQTVTIQASYLLPPGTYILTASTSGKEFNEKVILQ
jgi:hypothetical protein